jgi:hypothetical protein
VTDTEYHPHSELSPVAPGASADEAPFVRALYDMFVGSLYDVEGSPIALGPDPLDYQEPWDRPRKTRKPRRPSLTRLAARRRHHA